MSAHKFTPGPWKVDFNNSTKPFINIQDQEKNIIASVPDSELIYGDQTIIAFEDIEANAQLIAAAPDMYEALTRACDRYCIGYDGDNIVNCDNCIIQKAIRKARGEKE